MILYGTRIKLIGSIEIEKKELCTKCQVHGLPLKYVIGKKYYTMYFIPMNYFFAKERVFKKCDKCKEDDYEVVDDVFADLILKLYHKKITVNDFNNLTHGILKEKEHKDRIQSQSDEEYFKKFIRIAGIIIVAYIIILILKFVFKLF